jgi:FkbM family methyltransferase
MENDTEIFGQSEIRTGRLFVFYCPEATMKWLKALGYYLQSLFLMVFQVHNWLTLLPLFLRKPNGRESMLRLKHPPVVMWVRSAMDAWSVKETFLDAFYTRYGIPVENGWKVVDIGAGIGDFAVYAAWSRPQTVVLAFEPFPGSYRLLAKNLSANHLTNVEIFPMAVWGSGGDLLLDLSSGEPLQIASIASTNGDARSAKIAVPAVTLQSLVDQHQLDCIDLLKLDCEGAEYEILMKTPASILKKIERIIMEYHDLNETANHKVLSAFLESQGYRVRLTHNFVHEEIGYLYAQRVQSAGDCSDE